MSGNIVDPRSKEDWLEYCWCRDFSVAQTIELLTYRCFNVTVQEIKEHNKQSNKEMNEYFNKEKNQ